jgi:hypothetical protein
MTAIQTPLGLLSFTRMVEGGTNSFEPFQSNNSNVRHDNIPNRCMVFLDDVGIKGPTTRYGDVEVYPGIRQFVLKHRVNVDLVLADYERAVATVAGLKSSWCKPGINIVGFVCTEEGRFPEAKKVEMIVLWPACTSVTEVRAFLGVATYNRIWIKDLTLVVAPLFRLQRKGIDFNWVEDQTTAMDTIKQALTSAPALVTPRYSPTAGILVLAVDAGGEGWGAVLMQIQQPDKKRHQCRYESGVWAPAERTNDAGKKECKGLLKAQKKMRFWLYGVRFRVEIDARTLVYQVNLPANDLPGAMVTRWIAWIRLFDFDVVHMLGKQHSAADGLSRRKGTEEDVAEAEAEDPEEVKEFLDQQLFACRVSVQDPASMQKPIHLRVQLISGKYAGKWEEIGCFLETLELPARLSDKQRLAFRREATKFFIRDGYLFR